MIQEMLRDTGTEPLPPTQKQLLYARQIALRSNATLPWEVQNDRRALSRWIDHRKSGPDMVTDRLTPSSKQVAFAERIARIRRRDIPDEYYRSREEMSRWIDRNRPA